MIPMDDRADGDLRTIRRILVALDASADSVAGLEAAADLAALLRAELLGLFVEDLDLVQLPSLSFATEIDSLSGEIRPLAPDKLERHLRQRAARARRSLEEVASRLRVAWSFRTVRGRVSTELMAAEADLIALGTRGHSPRRGTGSTAATVLAHARTPVLVLRRDSRLGRTVHTLHDGSTAADHALAVAAEIARRRETPLTVFIPGRDASERREEAERVRRLVQETAGGEIEVRKELLPETDPRPLADTLRRRGCGLLVLPRSSEPSGRRNVTDLVRHVHCPILVVG